MDMKNHVTEFEKFMMTDPDEDTWEENIKKAKENLKMQNFETAKVYPTSIMEKATETGKPPRCIFIPSKAII